MSHFLDRHGPEWRAWILSNLRGGSPAATIVQAMLGPLWSEAHAWQAVREGAAELVRAHRVETGDLTYEAPWTLFVGVASFCDDFLVRTLTDARDKARRPEWLTFGVVDQHPHDRRQQVVAAAGWCGLRYTALAPRDSRGVCWARSLSYALLQDEAYVLQIDSHTLFDRDWDLELVRGHRALSDRHPRLVLTAYPPSFELHPDQSVTLQADSGESTMVLRPGPDQRPTEADPRMGFRTEHVPGRVPILGCHIAGGFFFTTRDFVGEVPYDPQLYFLGEEQSLALRAFTRGWDIVHPPRVPLYHLYKQNGGHLSQHWNESRQLNTDVRWGELDAHARERLSDMIYRRRDLGAFNLGTVRSLDDYARHSGIDYLRGALIPEHRPSYPVADAPKAGPAPLNLLYTHFTHVTPNKTVLNLCGAREPRAPYTPQRDPDLTVVLNGWGRPKALPLVWEAVQYQSRRPAETWVIQNDPEGVAVVPRDFLAAARAHHTRVFDADLNLGCWFRFVLAALYCRTRYVAFFDDDTLPGTEALAAALADLEATPGVYGGRGIIYRNEGGPPRFWSHDVEGWQTGTPLSTRVDFVGHAWVMEAAWLREILRLLPRGFLDAPAKGRECGEDMFLSFAAQQLGIPTFVWGHGGPCNPRWSSVQALELGRHPNAMSMGDGLSAGDRYLAELLAAGWRLLRFPG